MGILKKIKEVAKPLYEDDKFLGSFLDKSGIAKKPNYQKETYKVLVEKNKLAETRNKILEWQVLNPGKTMPQDVLDKIKEK